MGSRPPTVGEGDLPSGTGGGQGAWIQPGFPLGGITSGANGAVDIRSTNNEPAFAPGDMDRHLNIVADPVFSGNQNAVVDDLDIGIVKANWNKMVGGAAGRDLPNAGYFFDPNEGTLGDEIPQGDACTGLVCGGGQGDGRTGQDDLNQSLREFGRKTPGRSPSQLYHNIVGFDAFGDFAPTDAPGNPKPLSGVAFVRDLGRSMRNLPNTDGAGPPTYRCNCYNLDRVIMGVGWNNPSASGNNAVIGNPANEINTTNLPGLGRIPEAGWRFYVRDHDAVTGTTQDFGDGVVTAPVGGPGVLAFQFVAFGSDFTHTRIEVEADIGPCIADCETETPKFQNNINGDTPNLGDPFSSTAIAPAPEDDGGWHLVGFTTDGSGTAAGIKLFLDGRELPVTSTHDVALDPEHSILAGTVFPPTPIFSPSELTIGNARGRIDAWEGLIDEWAYFNKELTVQDMVDLYSLATTGALPAGPVPEPASLALLALGGLVLAARRR